ncbi:MAG: nucleoside triphosphate pyrophosphatase [Gammaproteobacteria bacterium]
MTDPASPALVLASSSRYRRELLARLCIPFATHAPDVDENARPGEDGPALVIRLARAKAAAAALAYPSAFVVGSDQVLMLEGAPVSKPGCIDAARRQLAAASGRTIRFHTGVCVRAPDGRERARDVVTDVTFRALDAPEIDRYLLVERPFDCAGSFRIEGLGIALVTAVGSEDPTALIGLPLIAVSGYLRDLGLDPLAALPEPAD